MKSGGVKIVVVGVGGGGCNMVENLIDSDSVDDVKLVAINTDAQAVNYPTAKDDWASCFIIS